MKTLKTLTLIGAAAVLALSATAASAQMYEGRNVDGAHNSRAYDGRGYDGRGYDGRYGADRRDGQRYGVSISQRLAQLDRRIDRGVERGDLDRREAWAARGQFRQIAQRQQIYRSNGYTRWELADLDQRLDSLEAQVRADRHDDQYGYGYGGENRR